MVGNLVFKNEVYTLSEKFNYFILLISKSQKAVRSYNIPSQLPFRGEPTMQILKLYTMVLNKIQVFTRLFKK
jgi:hypothetical protein